jgi:hypothetical protein
LRGDFFGLGVFVGSVVLSMRIVTVAFLDLPRRLARSLSSTRWYLGIQHG